MYVIYPADDLISLLITREYTQRRTRSGISPVVPPTPEEESDNNDNTNRPFRFFSNINNNNSASSTNLFENQEQQFEPHHQVQSDIFLQQRRDQHSQVHFSDSRENSLERYFVQKFTQELTETRSSVGEGAAASSFSVGALALSAALFPASLAAVASSQTNNPPERPARARSTTPAPGERSVSATVESRLPRPASFVKEGSAENSESGSKSNKPKRSVSFHTFDRKNSATRSQPGLVNGQPPSVAAVTTSRLNLNRRVSPAPDLVETRQGFGSNTNITTTSNNPSSSKSNSLIKKGKSWLPRITFSIQEEREEHPTSAGATSAPTPSTPPGSSSSSSHHQSHHHHHHRQHHHSDQHIHSASSSQALPSPGPASAPVQSQDSFAEYLEKSYCGAGNSSSAIRLRDHNHQQSLIHPPAGSKGQRGASPAAASVTTPTSGHQRFTFKNHSGKAGGIGLGGAALSPSGGALAAGLGGMAGVNGGVSAIGSLMSIGIGHHAQHLMPGQLVDANSLKDCVHPSLNESLKSHNSLSFKVIRIVSDFTQQLSQLHEQHAVQLQMLIENYRKRNAELRKERPPCNSAMFQIWETLLQEVELDSQAHSDVSASLARQVARPLLEKTFCLKIQSRKVFAHRESFETVLSKTEALLAKAYRDYSDACMQHIQICTNQSLAQYYEAHNAYIQQLRGTNSMLKEYHSETLPALLQELEDVYVDLCKELSDSVMIGSEIIAIGSPDSTRRYDQLAAVCRNYNGLQDLKEFVKTMVVPAQPLPRHSFTLPMPLLSVQEGDFANQDLSHVPVLKDELIMDRLITNSIRNRVEGLKKEMAELEAETKPIQDSLDTLVRMQQRSLDSNLFNKANELQEEISMKRFDLRVAQMQLAALRAQRELFGPLAKSETSASTGKFGKLDRIGGGDTVSIAGEDQSTGSGGSGGKGIDRKLSAATAQTMKSKWLKAFKSLKTTGPADKEADKKNAKDKDNKEPFQIFENHIFQEYTYKKITPCDICSQILRGHTRQGLRCRMCKMNVHADCQEKVDKCQPKTRLLRRQRSTSELETRLSQMADAQQEGEDTGDGGGGGSGGGSISATATAATTPKATTSKGKFMDELDQTYQVLKEANVLKKPGGSGGSGGSGNGLHGSCQTLHSQHEMTPARHMGRSNPSVNVIPGPGSSGHNTPAAGLGHHPMSVAAAPSSVPHSPRRRKLDLRMKSFSLDSPESTEHANRRRYAHGSHSTSHSQSPSSPVHNRRTLLSARNMRMSSVELPDENDKSHSSASTSPCPSPQKPHRLLPTNLYVVLYNFKARHPDELDLKAGYKITVIDTTDPDWWQGKCLGRVGYFPSKYVTKLHSGEKPLQVTHNLQVTDGADNGLKLLRDQIVIQIGEELDGMVTIRNGENKTGVCPRKYLQEV